MAANGLKFATLTRVPKPEKLVTLLLLFILLTAATAGVTSVLTGPNWGSLWRGLLIGLLIGWSLAIIRQPAWRSALITTLLGAAYALLYAGGLRQKISDILSELFFVLSRISTSPQDPKIDLSSITHLLAESYNTTGVIIGRVYKWANALVLGEPTFDPVAAAFVWISLVWIVAAWAGWVAIARRNALLAVLPALLLSIGTLSLVHHESFTIYLMLGVTLLLLATVQHDRREQGWDEIDAAYPPRKGKQVGNAAVIISVVIVLLSAIMSSISIPRIVEWVSARRGPLAQGESGLADSLGIVTDVTATPDIFADLRRPGLPRDQLIGSGPELSKRIVMTVEIEDYLSIFKGEQTQPLYWRSFTYDNYTGRGWQTSDTVLSEFSTNQRLQPDQAPQHTLIEQNVHPVGKETRNVYAAGEPVAINHSGEAAWRSPEDLFGILIERAASYEASSLIPVVDEQTLRTEDQNYPDWVRRRFLSLPSEIPGRVKDLALQLTASEPTPYDRVRAIELYLRTFPYTLDVPYPPLDQDLVDYFLFDLRKGYCDYYASAMVILARAAGVPARFAVGYASGIYNVKSDRFLVSEADAHSWVEIYFPNAGWVPFEPTAGRPPLERSMVSTHEFDSSLTFPEGISTPVQTNSLHPGWLFLFGLMTFIGISVITWVAFDEIRLHRLPEPAAATEVYQRIRGFGALLAVTFDPGITPYEYADSLNSRLQEISLIGVSAEFVSRISEELSSIMQRIVETSYRPSEYQGKSNKVIVYQWKVLRWPLGLFWLLMYYQLVHKHLWRVLAKVTINKSAAAELED